jgi:ATP-binding cassette subfamily B protein
MHSSRKLSRFVRPYLRWAVLAPLLMVLEVAMDLMQPRLLQTIIDRGIAHGDMAAVTRTGALMLTAAVLGLGGGMGCTYYSVLASQSFGTDLRRSAFGKVQSLSFGNLDALETGSLITRLTNDISQVQDMLMMLLRVMVRMPLMLVGSLIMAIVTSPSLAVLFAVLMPLIGIVLVWIVAKTSPLFGQAQHRLDILNTVLQENLAGVRVVKAFARAKHEIARFQDANANLMGLNITAVRIGAVTMPFMMLCVNAGVVAALWLGGHKVALGQMHVGQVIAFTNYLQQTLMSLMMVSMLVTRFARAEASAQRIGEVLASEPKVPNPADALRDFAPQNTKNAVHGFAPQNTKNAVHGFAPQGRVTFENVTFSYEGAGGDPVLREISFVAEPGQTVAILGATGAGKSSLVNLIPRFYDVSLGRVTIDGVDVRAIDEETLRKRVGIALQESVLFSGSIRDNIRYGKPDARDEDVIAAAKTAQAHGFIMGFPEGYDTVVGQRGVNLSGGQKQRLAIARVLMVDPGILILDDSTSAVDVRTEARIHEALTRERRGRTCIIVAQRISTVLGADKILVLEDGRIAAEGSHADLLAASPIYREIYESQTDNGVVVHAGE